MSTFSLTEVCCAVMREGITSYIEHVGGGTMTLYAGHKVGAVWTVAAGPGRYPTTIGETVVGQTRVREAISNTENFHVGPGGRSSGHIWTCPELATVAEIADEIISQVRALTPVVAPVKSWPETDAERDAFLDWQYEVSNSETVHGFRDWLAAEKESDDQS